MQERQLKVHVQLGPGFDARQLRESFHRGEYCDLSPYGFHLAESRDVSVAFSQDAPGRRPGRLLRTVNRKLRFDVDHAWHNRGAIAASDIVWTMGERETFAVAALMMLRLIPRRPVIGASIWLFNEWHRLPRASQAIYRTVSRYVDVLTVHSAASLDVAAQAALHTRIELSPFGINEESFPPLPPRVRENGDGNGVGAPIHVLAAGNDRTRDWDTLLAAVGNDERFVVSAWTPVLGAADTARIRNLRLPKPPTNADVRAMYAAADVVIVPMVPNLFSGITVALEAASLGRPVICSETGGVPTYFSPDEVRFVPPGNSAALKAAVLEARTPRMAEMAAAAHARFGRGDFTTRAMIGRYLALTDRLLGRRGPTASPAA